MGIGIQAGAAMSGYQLFSLTDRKAAKAHRCIWCGEAIAVGERYQDERSVYDGEFQHHKWHPECQADAQEDWRQGGDAEFMPWSAPRPQREVQP
jgi:hypothetical protein